MTYLVSWIASCLAFAAGVVVGYRGKRNSYLEGYADAYKNLAHFMEQPSSQREDDKDIVDEGSPGSELSGNPLP